MNDKMNEVLKQCVNLHWLRPDNALWVLSFYQTFGKVVQEACAGKARTLDLGCGDGTTSFLMLDGKLNKSFDVYHDVQVNLEVDTKRSESGSLRDEKGDFYNVYTDNWQKYLKIDEQTKWKFDLGSDWKEALTKKAFDLNAYDKVEVYDANNRFPYEDNSLDFIFSTIIYWLSDTGQTLKEVSRVLDKGGMFAFSCPKEEILDHTLQSMIGKYDYPEIESLDRGRHANWKRHASPREAWEKKIAEAGLKVVDYKNFHSSLQISMGETWVRTLLPAYKVLYNRLLPQNDQVWQEFKDVWSEEVVRLLTPFTDESWINSEKNPSLYHAFFCIKE